MNFSIQKSSNILFHEYLFSARQELHAKGQTADGRQTDRRDKANCHFSQFCEPAIKTKINKLFHVDRYPRPGWNANPQSYWSSGRTL